MALDQSPEAKAARKDRLKRLFDAPTETMETIYAHVANGGTILTLCDTWDIRYSDIVLWIDKDDSPGGRKKMYADAIQARNEWADEMLIAGVRAIAQIDIRKLYYEKGHPRAGALKDMGDLDAATAQLVSAVEVKDFAEGTGEDKKVGTVTKVKVWDKLKAQEMAMKNRRLLVDKVEHEGSLKLEDLVGRSLTEPAAPEAGPTSPAVAPGQELSATATATIQPVAPTTQESAAIPVAAAPATIQAGETPSKGQSIPPLPTISPAVDSAPAETLPAPAEPPVVP